MANYYFFHSFRYRIDFCEIFFFIPRNFVQISQRMTIIKVRNLFYNFFYYFIHWNVLKFVKICDLPRHSQSPIEPNRVLHPILFTLEHYVSVQLMIDKCRCIAILFLNFSEIGPTHDTLIYVISVFDDPIKLSTITTMRMHFRPLGFVH